MKNFKYHPIFIAFVIIFCNIFSFAQSSPGIGNLMHQWTFDDGTARDIVTNNPVNGTLMGNARVENKALILSSQGQYLSFSGTALALNTYPVISQEIWFTPTAGANDGFAHLTYFGRTVNNNGSNFLFMMPARGDNESRTAISDGGLNNQVIVKGPEYDDGNLHQFVSVVRYDSLFFYIDGRLVDKVRNIVPLSGISTTLAYIGRSGFTADPTWIGSVSKYSIYNKSLSQSEVDFLYKMGAEDTPTIITSSSSLNFNSPGIQKIAVWGLHLEQNISIQAPNNFSLSNTSFSYNVNGDSLSITYLGESNSSGYIYLTSGNTRDSIFVSGSINPSIMVSHNRIVLDEINNSASFSVWGNNLDSNIAILAPSGINISNTALLNNASSTEVSISYNGLQNSSGTIILSSGSARAEIEIQAGRNSECFIPLFPENLISDPTLNIDASGEGITSINSNPAFVYCGSRSGEVAENGRIERNLNGILKPNTQYRVRAKVYKNHPAIKPGNMGAVTYTLAMDSATNPDKYQLIKIAMDSACSYYNKYTPFVKDIYVYYNEGIPTAQASHLGSIGFGPNTTYMWVGTAIHEMAHYFGSGTSATWQLQMSSRVWAGEAGANFMMNLNGEVLRGDSQHYWPYGINYRSEITNLGSQAIQHTALINATKLIKAMLVDDCRYPTYNTPTGIGIIGHDNSLPEMFHEIYTAKNWETVDFSFTTGTSIATNPKIYFQSGMGYIDNWELYEIKEEINISLSLSFGWNLVSIPIAFTDMSVNTVFPNATYVKDMTSFYYSHQPPIFNSLQNIKPGNAYLIYNTTNETIQYEGYELSNTDIYIPQDQTGWGLIGTPTTYAIHIENILSEYLNEIEMIKNFEGFWQPNENNNSIQLLEPGKGYFVKLNE